MRTGGIVMSDEQRPDRNLAIELVRVTEAAALAAGPFIGRGDKIAAAQAAVGNGGAPGVAGAAAPTDGPRLTSVGQPNALSVIALAERGTMFFPGAAVYMEKVATGAEAADVIHITPPPEENVRLVAGAKGERGEEVAVTILDRAR